MHVGGLINMLPDEPGDFRQFQKFAFCHQHVQKDGDETLLIPEYLSVNRLKTYIGGQTVLPPVKLLCQE